MNLFSKKKGKVHKYKQRILAIVLSLIMAIPISVIGEWNRNETFAANNVTIDGVVYSVYSFLDHTAKVTGYTDDISENVVIKDNVDIDGTNYEVISIGYAAFQGCDKVESVIIPKGVKTLEQFALRECNSLKNVDLPIGLEDIAYGAFYKDRALVSVDIKSGLTHIGEMAFQYCTLLQSIELPQSLLEIEQYAFSNCESLKTIVLSEGLSIIGEGAFYKCSTISSIKVPSTVTQMGINIIGNCSAVASITVDSKNSKYTSGTAETNAIIEKDTNKLVSGCKTTKIPSYVKSIGDCAFSGCTEMTEITLPSGLLLIGSYAFSGCLNLKSIVIPDGVTSIGKSAFDYCIRLKSINVPAKVTDILESTFKNCEELTSVTLSSSLKNIGSYAFYNCYNLATIDLPEGLKTIGDTSFSSCSSLSSVKLPASLEIIGDTAFSGCKSITSVNIPAKVKSIGRGAYGYCVTLESIVVDKNNAVYTSDAVGTNAIIDKSTGELLAGCSNTIIPDYVTAINYSAFYGSGDLLHIELPDNVSEIGIWAFAECNKMTSIACPDTIKNIGDAAFYGCGGLTTCYTYSYTNKLPTNDVITNTQVDTLTNLYRLALDGGSFCSDWPQTTKLTKCNAVFAGWEDIKGNITEELPDIAGSYKAVFIYPDVTIVSGDGCNFTKTTESGSEQQNDVYGKMVDIIYTANAGYYFPENYNTDKALDKNGVKVVRNSYTQITVTGEPNADTKITLKAATKKAEQGTPAVKDGILKINGTTTKMEFASTPNATKWKACTDGSTAANKGTYYVRYKQTSTLSAGTVKKVTVSAQSISNLKATLSITSYTYNAKYKTPDVTISGLTKDTDYTVTYVNNKNPGTATAVITGIGNYSGVLKVKYNIEIAKVTALFTKLYGYNDVNVYWSKTTGASGYVVYYKKSSDSEWSKLTTTTKTYYNVADLSDGVKYSFKVVPYVSLNGNKCYSDENTVTSSIYTLKKMSTPTVSKYSSSIATVKWTKISGTTGYQIARSKSENSGYSVVKNVASSNASTCVSSTNGVKYYYKVRAYKTVGDTTIYGPWSSPKVYTIK